MDPWAFLLPLLQQVWWALGGLYYGLRGEGLQACLAAVVVGWMMTRWGLRLTGREESFTGSVHNGWGTFTRNPAIPGTAQTWMGRLFGQMLQLGGFVLMAVALLALVHGATG